MIQPDIIFNCGFRTITYNCEFKNNKGVKLFESGHVHTVSEVQQPNGYGTINGYVIRQTSVTLPPYKVTFEVGTKIKCKKVTSLILQLYL